ncbi:MAG: Holliday junction resolvase RuvX [Pirellulaceae bacterium]|nr:Holliday junction resolvase RuvX [Pirellulaceae bacterium]
MSESHEPVTLIPSQGKLAGIDYGSVRIGVSICDATQCFVSPLHTYNRRNERLDARHFLELAHTEKLVGWIIGLPIHCDGQESQKSQEVRQFAGWLQEISSLPYAFCDERFSSREARTLMHDTGWSPQKKKKRLDGLAAYLILTHFLESRHALLPRSLEDRPKWKEGS